MYTVGMYYGIGNEFKSVWKTKTSKTKTLRTKTSKTTTAKAKTLKTKTAKTLGSCPFGRWAGSHKAQIALMMTKCNITVCLSGAYSTRKDFQKGLKISEGPPSPSSLGRVCGSVALTALL